MSMITQKALAASLKKLLSQKNFSQVSVKDITEDCGVNRQTFYYHFHDIDDLVRWIYAHELAEGWSATGVDQWPTGLRQLLTYLTDNRAFVLNTYQTIDPQIVIDFLDRQVEQLLLAVLDTTAPQLTTTDKQFIATTYRWALGGAIREWLSGGLTSDPEELVDRLARIIEPDLHSASAALES